MSIFYERSELLGQLHYLLIFFLVSVSQAPVVFALGSKTSFVGVLIGKCYERVSPRHWVLLWKLTGIIALS